MKPFIDDDDLKEVSENLNLLLLALVSLTDNVAVYHARDQNTGNKYTVKFINKATLPNITQFYDGLEILRRCHCEEILYVKDVIDMTDKLFLVIMEFCQFNDLLSYIHDKEEPLIEATSLHIMYQISLAIANLHRQRIVHNNIRSSNVLVKEAGEGHKMKIRLSGFSRAHYFESDFFSQEDPYIAPEIINCQRGTFQSDIFSLGILFYEIITSRTPGDFIAHTKASDPFSGEIWKRRSPQLQQLIKRMLEIDPAKRPTVEEILGDPVFLPIREGRLKTETELSAASIIESCYFDEAFNDNNMSFLQDENLF